MGSIEWAVIRQDGKWLVLNAQDGKFPEFSGTNLGTQKNETGNAAPYFSTAISQIQKIVKLCKFETN